MDIKFEKSDIERYEEQVNVKVDAVGNYGHRVFKEDGVCVSEWLVAELMVEWGRIVKLL